MNVVSPSKQSNGKKKKIVKRKKVNNEPATQHNFSVVANSLPQLLATSTPQRRKRQDRGSNLESSLVHSAMLDVQDANRIKAEYRYSNKSSLTLGKLFLSFDIDRKLRDMYSSIRSIQEVDENQEFEETKE